MADNTQDRILRLVATRVEEDGWAAMSVHHAEDSPTFTYSIGFEKTFHCPEVLFVGFSPEVAQNLIASIAHQLTRREIVIPEKTRRIAQVIQTYDVLARPVAADQVANIARIAATHHYPKPFRLVQILLPDASGLLPGEDGCDPAYVAYQELTQLYE